MPTNITFIYDNPVDRATLTPSSEAGGMPADNLKTKLRSEKWRTTGCASESLIIMTPGCEALNVLSIVEHNFTAAATIRVQANSSNSWASTPVDITFTALEPPDIDDAGGFGMGGFGEGGFGGGLTTLPNRLQVPIVIFIDELLGGATVGYLYKKITFTDPYNSNGYIEMGRLYLSDYYESSRNYIAGAKIELIDESVVEYSENGVPFTDEKPMLMEVGIGINNITILEKNTLLFPMFCAVGRKKDFVLVLDPSTVIGRLTTSGYGRFTSNLPLTQRNYDYYDAAGISWRESR